MVKKKINWKDRCKGLEEEVRYYKNGSGYWSDAWESEFDKNVESNDAVDVLLNMIDRSKFISFIKSHIEMEENLKDFSKSVE